VRLILTRDVFSNEWTLGTLHVEYDGTLMYMARGWQSRPQDMGITLPFGFVCEDQDRGRTAA